MIYEVAPDVWRVPGPDLRLPGGVRMPLASTVIRVADRKLVVFARRLDDERAAAIEALGTVAHVVAPNRRITGTSPRRSRAGRRRSCTPRPGSPTSSAI